MTERRGVYGERQDSRLGAQKKPGQEAWVGESAWASLGSLSKYGRFFCLHLSHAGHGPRDLLSRYCRQDCASPAGLRLPFLATPSQHLPDPPEPELSPPAGSPTPFSDAPAPIEESLGPHTQETHIPSAACSQPVRTGESVTNIYRAAAGC